MSTAVTGEDTDGSRVGGLMRRAGATALWQVLATALMAFNMLWIARDMGPSTTGVVVFVSGSAAIVTMLSCGGTGAGLRLIHVRTGQTNLGGYAFASIAVVTFAGVAGAGLVTLAAAKDIESPPAIAISVAFFVVFAAARQGADASNAMGMYVASAFGLALAALVQSVALLTLSLTGNSSLPGALACYLAGPLTQLAVAAVVLSRCGVGLRREGSREQLGALVRAGFPSYVSDVSMSVTQRLDRMILLPLLGPTAAGIFAVAATCAEASRLLATTAAQMTFLHAGQSAYASAVRRVQGVALAAQVTVLAATVAGAAQLVSYLLGDWYEEAEGLLIILVGAELLMTVLVLGMAQMAGEGRRRSVVAVGSLVAVAAVVLYPLGTLAGGVRGLAAGKCLTYLAGGLAVLVVLLPATMRTGRVGIRSGSTVTAPKVDAKDHA